MFTHLFVGWTSLLFKQGIMFHVKYFNEVIRALILRISEWSPYLLYFPMELSHIKKKWIKI